MYIAPLFESPAPSPPVHYGSETEGTETVMARADRRRLSRQMSSVSKAPRDAVWERRRWQHVLRKKYQRKSIDITRSSTCLESGITDEDLSELKGCIELGFGFKEEGGQALCNTLPALDLYFAVNRQLSPSPRSTLQGNSPWSPSGSSPPSPSGSTTSDTESWKICSPGDDPEHVKTKLRHWAQAVACSLMQTY
ncbi:hypothetical protein SAY86_009317 [Trapa natans]|uniref:Uncharacterized protein n=1 Tax=Trapa natans TaxID=22666 RepID=A0AAN7L4M7_TRANT|nr:hypothetical protein SAY86_009317 [Trapa natans]